MLQIPSPPQMENGERKKGGRRREARREAEEGQRRGQKGETEIVVLRGALLDREQVEFFQGHRRSQGRDRQSQETVNKETPGGRAATRRGKAVKCVTAPPERLQTTESARQSRRSVSMSSKQS